MQKSTEVILFRPAEKEENKELYFKEVMRGLSYPQKYIDFKFAYDEEGSQMLNEINNSEKYYLSDSQSQLIQQESSNILEVIGREKFNLIDLGAGDGVKTQILVSKAIEEEYEFEYIPLDISYDSNRMILKRYEQHFPHLTLTAVTSEYEEGIDWILTNKPGRNVYFFLGGTIGNLSEQENQKFILMLSGKLRKGDLFFVGFDEFKDPQIINSAYQGSDPMLFNQLKRINRDLNSNFNVTDFYSHIYFDPFSRQMIGTLLSKKELTVQIRERVISFKKGEVIQIARSKKWFEEEIIELFSLGGFCKVRGYSHKENKFGLFAFEKKQ